MIVYDNVSKSFDGGQIQAVKEISLEVQDGETLVLLGSSGCGKTTLLKLVNRLLEPTSGKIELDGEDVSLQDPIALRRRIGYVFQGIGLFPHMTVEENVAMVPRLLGWPTRRRRERARELLVLVGLDPEKHAKRYVGELSGGQQQRIGVGRALAADPEYLLMDEPFGALDAITRDALQQELLSLKQRLRKTIVFVTHDIFEALTLGDRIAVLHAGELHQVGAPQEVLSRPATPFVHQLFAKPAEQLSAFEEML
jgi:osmoprotectant transport system ATP-binding protein